MDHCFFLFMVLDKQEKGAYFFSFLLAFIKGEQSVPRNSLLAGQCKGPRKLDKSFMSLATPYTQKERERERTKLSKRKLVQLCFLWSGSKMLIFHSHEWDFWWYIFIFLLILSKFMNLFYNWTQHIENKINWLENIYVYIYIYLGGKRIPSLVPICKNTCNVSSCVSFLWKWSVLKIGAEPPTTLSDPSPFMRTIWYFSTTPSYS